MSSADSTPLAEVCVVGVGYGAHGQLMAHGTSTSLVAPDATEVVTVVASAIARDQDVVVVHPHWRDDLRRTVQTARASLDVDRVLVHGSDVPPLAGAVLVAQLAALADRGAALGPLAGVLARLEGAIDPLAWLGSVSRLSRLTPSMAQHARSLLPGSGFVACAGAHPRVERVSRKHARLTLPLSAAEHALALSAHERGDREWVVAALQALGVDDRIVEVAPLTESVTWWGTDRLVELAVYDRDPERLPAPEHAITACEWCGHHVATDPCPVCGMHRLAGPVRGG